MSSPVWAGPGEEVVSDAPIELDLDGHIVVLDGNVLEVFSQGAGESYRHHVRFIGVDGKPNRDGGLTVVIGTRTTGFGGGGIAGTGSTRLKIPAEKEAEFTALIEEAKRRAEA